MLVHDGEAPEISIIIPVFNETEAIQVQLDRIAAELDAEPEMFEVCVVDDGSTDGGLDHYTPKWSGVRVIRRPINMGNGAAVKTGIRRSRSEKCLIMDGDGQHLVSDALAVVRQLGDYDLVVGSRDFANSGSVHRNFANLMYSKLASYVADFQIADLTSGLRAFKKSAVLDVIHLFPNRFSSPTTMTLGLLRLGYAVKFSSISVQARDASTSSKIKIFSDGFKFLMIILKIATLFSPMKVFLPVSSLMFFTGASTFMYFFFVEQRLSVWSAVVLLTNAVMIFMMGLVAEELSQLKFKSTVSNAVGSLGDGEE